MSMSQIREERVKAARLRNGLTGEAKDIRMPPSNLVEDPSIKSQRELLNKRKQENVFNY